MNGDGHDDLRVKLGPDRSKMGSGGIGELWTQLTDADEEYVEKFGRAVGGQEVVHD